MLVSAEPGKERETIKTDVCAVAYSRSTEELLSHVVRWWTAWKGRHGELKILLGLKAYVTASAESDLGGEDGRSGPRDVLPPSARLQ